MCQRESKEITYLVSRGFRYLGHLFRRPVCRTFSSQSIKTRHFSGNLPLRFDFFTGESSPMNKLYHSMISVRFSRQKWVGTSCGYVMSFQSCRSVVLPSFTGFRLIAALSYRITPTCHFKLISLSFLNIRFFIFHSSSITTPSFDPSQPTFTPKNRTPVLCKLPDQNLTDELLLECSMLMKEK